MKNSPYYRRMFDGCGMQPGDIRTTDDLRRLPVTTKTDLQLHPGEFVCVPRNRIIDYVTTSGTLGDPVTFALTEEDLARLAYNEAMSFNTAGCTGEDILQLMTTIVRRADVAGLHAAAVEHAPVVRRIFIEVGDLIAQAFLLERRDRIGRCELYFRVSYHGLHSDLSLSIARSSSLRGTPASSALPKLCAARSSSPCER